MTFNHPTRLFTRLPDSVNMFNSVFNVRISKKNMSYCSTDSKKNHICCWFNILPLFYNCLIQKNRIIILSWFLFPVLKTSDSTNRFHCFWSCLNHSYNAWNVTTCRCSRLPNCEKRSSYLSRQSCSAMVQEWVWQQTLRLFCVVRCLRLMRGVVPQTTPESCC